MLKKIRRTFAIVFFAAVTLLFLDFTGTVHAWLGWVARIQFFPAIMAAHLGIVLILVALTFVFGRVYCSVICPLGIFQDIISWISGRRNIKAAMRFTWSPARKILRYGMLVLFIAAIAAGVGSIVALLEPYSAYGRMASNLFAPLWQWGNNLLAWLAERADSYAFYSTEVWLRSIPTFIIAALTFAIIAVLAWRHGRTYCNTVCPVGTVLGFISGFSLFRITVDAAKCRDCGLCARHCKSSCIDIQGHRVDNSRCVACFDCLDTCRHGAIRYAFRYNKPQNDVTHMTESTADAAGTGGKSQDSGMSRRGFLSVAAMAAGASALKAQEKKVDGGLAAIEEKKIPARMTKIVPAGSLSLDNFYRHCTACQLCVSACPNQVLRPSSALDTFMQPEMSYERGYCRPECTICSEVCPAGAIHPISIEEKSSIQIGHAVWVSANCIPLTDGQECGNCARHCPAGAIRMVRSDPGNPESLRIPAINTERCIGCGACENLCPARPFSAIYVEGHQTHREI